MKMAIISDRASAKPVEEACARHVKLLQIMKQMVKHVIVGFLLSSL